MNGKMVKTITLGMVTLSACLSGARPGTAQDAKTPYPNMAPIEQYLMDRDAEIALARSAAPEAISRDAKILVLGRHGYETAVEGKNGFVCMVERGWMGAFDYPEFWNPKVRGADCLNPQAARSILPIACKRTEMVMAGKSKAQIFDGIKAAFDKKELPAPEPGAMSYMMSKAAYLTDQGDHNGPHLMFFVPVMESAVWGADLPGSPLRSAAYWFLSESANRQLEGVPPIRVFVVGVGKWSDGTVARH